MTETAASSISEREIANFDRLKDEWWKPRGGMRALHAMNPLRTSWVNRRALPLRAARGGRLSLLDIGCGAGLASEAFAKLDYDVLGVDASGEAISAARAHLAETPLPPNAGNLTYRHGSAEDVLKEGLTFDVVTALEVIEHVRDPQAFLGMLAELTKPGGLIAVSTLNRTPRSYVVAKIGAEYITRMLPIGTHDWRQFIKPEELSRYGRAVGLRMTDVAGMSYIPNRWFASRDTGVNYIAVFARD